MKFSFARRCPTLPSGVGAAGQAPESQTRPVEPAPPLILGETLAARDAAIATLERLAVDALLNLRAHAPWDALLDQPLPVLEATRRHARAVGACDAYTDALAVVAGISTREAMDRVSVAADRTQRTTP